MALGAVDLDAAFEERAVLALCTGETLGDRVELRALCGAQAAEDRARFEQLGLRVNHQPMRRAEDRFLRQPEAGRQRDENLTAALWADTFVLSPIAT